MILGTHRQECGESKKAGIHVRSMEVAILTVGDELLSGDTVNTNATWLCARLYERGVEVTRVTVVPDDIEEIASVIQTRLPEVDAMIVTGGLGPTHDDMTLDGIARAIDRPLVENAEAKQWLSEEGGYSVDSLIDGTLELPRGAKPIHNEVGVAPGAVVDGIYVLPGVPAEMQSMFDRVADDFSGAKRYRRELTIDEPESSLLDRFEAVQERFEVSVGSYPGEVVTVKITSRDDEAVQQAADWLTERATTVSPEERTDPDQGDE